MRTLEEHNRHFSEEYGHWNTFPQRNGIECPQCGAELLDSNAVILTSIPPQKNVHCEYCRYRGYRVT
jgi:DNA-directed RNA polymerase subunit RPC12/RpoP